MKKLLGLSVVVVMVFALTPLAVAKEKKTKNQVPEQPVVEEVVAAAKLPGEKPGMVMGGLVSRKLAVTKINYEKRKLVMKDEEGKTIKFKAGPEIKNFAQIKVGDQVLVNYYDQVAMYVRKSTEAPTSSSSGNMQTAALGEKPGMVSEDTYEMTARVEAIDYDKRTVTLKGPEGETETLKVDNRVTRFNEVKVGDELVVNVSEAMAIDVVTPEAVPAMPEAKSQM